MLQCRTTIWKAQNSSIPLPTRGCKTLLPTNQSEMLQSASLMATTRNRRTPTFPIPTFPTTAFHNRVHLGHKQAEKTIVFNSLPSPYCDSAPPRRLDHGHRPILLQQRKPLNRRTARHLHWQLRALPYRSLLLQPFVQLSRQHSRGVDL